MAQQLHALVETAQPELAPFGLLSPAATVITDTDPHWANGFSYETSDCSTIVRVRGICASNQSATAVAPIAGPKFRNYVPFSVEAEYPCSTLGMLGGKTYAERARDRLEACFQKAAEFELWTGTLAKQIAADNTQWDAGTDGAFPNRYLASSDSIDMTPTPGTAIKPVEAMAILEGALADCGCGTRGTIHVTRDMGSVLTPYLVRSTDDKLITGLGNHVIAGAGYTGSGPTGAMPTPSTKVWAYATGPVTVRRGEVFITPDELPQSVKIDTNDVNVKAEQPAAVTWDGCCAFAILVDLTTTYN